jgi:hypothetical protein
MKKLFLLVSVFFVLATLKLSLPNQIKAAGTCSCTYSFFGGCDADVNNCATTETPVCNISSGLCDGSCTCTASSDDDSADGTLWCDSEKTKLNTAIGCIPVLTGNKEDFLAFILKWAVGIGSGIAFLLSIYGGFMIMTSSGNPEKIQAGRELLTSAVSGLILLILSIFILKVIGVDILGIPGFGQ